MLKCRLAEANIVRIINRTRTEKGMGWIWRCGEEFILFYIFSSVILTLYGFYYFIGLFCFLAAFRPCTIDLELEVIDFHTPKQTKGVSGMTSSTSGGARN